MIGPCSNSFLRTPRNSSSSFKKLVVLVSNIFSHFDSFFAFFLKMNEDLRPWFIDNHAILILMRFRMFDMLRLCIIICPYSKDKTLLGIVTLLMPMLPNWFFLSIFELIYHVWCIFMLLAIFLTISMLIELSCLVLILFFSIWVYNFLLLILYSRTWQCHMYANYLVCWILMNVLCNIDVATVSYFLWKVVSFYAIPYCRVYYLPLRLLTYLKWGLLQRAKIR